MNAQLSLYLAYSLSFGTGFLTHYLYNRWRIWENNRWYERYSQERDNAKRTRRNTGKRGAK